MATDIEIEDVDIPTDPRERRNWVTFALRQAGSSYAAIARELKVSSQYVQQAVTNNHARPQEAIAEKLGIPVWRLFPEWFGADRKRIVTGKIERQNSAAARRRPVDNARAA